MSRGIASPASRLSRISRRSIAGVRCRACSAFAWHPVTGVAADHRHVDQWEFYVVRECKIGRKFPDQKTIGLKRVADLAQPVGYGDLAAAVEKARAGLASLKKDTLP